MQILIACMQCNDHLATHATLVKCVLSVNTKCNNASCNYRIFFVIYQYYTMVQLIAQCTV